MESQTEMQSLKMNTVSSDPSNTKDTGIDDEVYQVNSNARKSMVNKMTTTLGGWKQNFNCCNILTHMATIHGFAFLMFMFSGGLVYFQFAYPLRSWHELYICHELRGNWYADGRWAGGTLGSGCDDPKAAWDATDALTHTTANCNGEFTGIMLNFEQTEQAVLDAGIDSNTAKVNNGAVGDTELLSAVPGLWRWRGNIPTTPLMAGYEGLQATYMRLFNLSTTNCHDMTTVMADGRSMFKHRIIFGIYDCVASTAAMTYPLFIVWCLWGWQHIQVNQKRYLGLWFAWLFTNLFGWTTRDLLVYDFGRIWFYLSDFAMGPPMVFIFCLIYSKWIEKDTQQKILGKQFGEGTGNENEPRQSVMEAPFHCKFMNAFPFKLTKIKTRNGSAMFMQTFAWLGAIGVYLFGLTVFFSFPCMEWWQKLLILCFHYGTTAGVLMVCFKSCVLYTNTRNDRTLTLSWVGILMWTSLAERFMILDIDLVYVAPFLIIGLIAKIFLKVRQDRPGKLDGLFGVHPSLLKGQRFKNLVGDKEYMTMTTELCSLLLAAIVRVGIYRFWTDLYMTSTKSFADCKAIGREAEWLGASTAAGTVLGDCRVKQEVTWECDAATGINHCYSSIMWNVLLQYGIELVEMTMLVVGYHKRLRSVGKYWGVMVVGYLYILLFFGLHFFYNYYFKLQQEMGVPVSNVFGIGEWYNKRLRSGMNPTDACTFN